MSKYTVFKAPGNRGFLFITHPRYIAKFQKSANKNQFLYNGLFRPGSGFGLKVDAVARWQRFLPYCTPLCRIKYYSLFLDSYMPDSDVDTDCATMSVRTLRHIPNRRVFHRPCDNARQAQTPAQLYCDYRCESSGPRVPRYTYYCPSICSAPPAVLKSNHRHCA